MLFLPYRDARRPRYFPIATVVVALACLAGFFWLQSQDPQRRTSAFESYQDSGLAAIELPRYRTHLAGRNDADAESRLARLGSTKVPVLQQIEMMLGDEQFQRELRSGVVVPPDDPQFAAWSEARSRYGQLISGSSTERFSLSRADAKEAWRFLSYPLLHTDATRLLGALLVLLLLAPFAEAALGSVRYVIALAAGTAAAGVAHLAVSEAPLIGSAGLVAAAAAMSIVVSGARRVPAGIWLFSSSPLRIPVLALFAAWPFNEALQAWLRAGSGQTLGASDLLVPTAGFLVGAIAAALLRPEPQSRIAVPTVRSSAAPGTLRTVMPVPGEATTALAREAQEAASRLDVRRAVRLYRELVEQEPRRIDYLGAYLNVALLSPDENVVNDAALRILWARIRHSSEEVRRLYLQLTQPKVLQAIPIDEHLRLARRLVRQREDAAALRVLDGVLQDEHLRSLYGRQLADCLLGLFTAYTRHGLVRQAEQVSARLSAHFDANDQLGGEAPALRPPTTLLNSRGGPTRAGMLRTTTRRSTAY